MDHYPAGEQPAVAIREVHSLRKRDVMTQVSPNFPPRRMIKPASTWTRNYLGIVAALYQGSRIAVLHVRPGLVFAN